MSENAEIWGPLLGRNTERVRTVLNLLTESPYFYREDDETAFNFLRRHRQEFARFFEQFFGWTLIVDSKCGRVYKERWYNGSVTESNRDFFNFTRRDECIAFMMILEYFEHQLHENDMTVEDRENLRFRFGDLLEFCSRRFSEIMDGQTSRYTPEHIRAKILRQVFPILERYRFVRKIPPPVGEVIDEEHTIYEALPAIHHYNSSYLHRNFDEIRSILQGERVAVDPSDEEEQDEGEEAL
ncbi:MAG: DUF2398 family protein [Fibrobacterota bacterium]